MKNRVVVIVTVISKLSRVIEWSFQFWLFYLVDMVIVAVILVILCCDGVVVTVIFLYIVVILGHFGSFNWITSV